MEKTSNTPKRNFSKFLFLFIVIASIVIYNTLPRPILSQRKENHKYFQMENIWTEDAFERLHGLLDRIGEAKKVLQTSKEKKKKKFI